MCVLGLTEDFEARVLEGMPGATHRERRRVQRKTGDGACIDSGGGTEGVERNGSDGKPRRYNYLEQGDLQEKFPRFNMYCCCIAVRVYTFSTAAVGKQKKLI